MDADKTAENVNTFLAELNRKKPADAKADFVRSISLSSSMGPGVWIENQEEA
jgi:large subunit ribosomal protein L1